MIYILLTPESTKDPDLINVQDAELEEIEIAKIYKGRSFSEIR